MRKVNPAQVAVFVMIGVMGLGAFGFIVSGILDARARQERLSRPDPSLVDPPSAEPSERPAPEPEPVDPEALEAALARFGSLDGWVAGGEACPEALPSIHGEVTRGPPDRWGVRPVITPPSPIPLRIARDVERALVRMDTPIGEPTLVLLRHEWSRPTLDNRRLFTGGRVTGRAFLLVPGEGDDPIRCVGDYSAVSSASVAADPSSLELSQLENELALTADLVLEERRAAVESLRRAERAP